MSEPSWADKTVDRYIANHGHDFTVYDVMRLLRAERSRARRIVRAIANARFAYRSEYDAGYQDACEKILNRLQ